MKGRRAKLGQRLRRKGDENTRRRRKENGVLARFTAPNLGTYTTLVLMLEMSGNAILSF